MKRQLEYKLPNGVDVLDPGNASSVIKRRIRFTCLDK